MVIFIVMYKAAEEEQRFCRGIIVQNRECLQLQRKGVFEVKGF